MNYVFGYASLVAVSEPGAVPGRLRGYRRRWGAAMNNWEGGEEVKHFLDRDSGERPRIRVAYLDIYEQADLTVNGLALPVDPARLTALDAREVNYARIEVSAAFEASTEAAAPTAIGRVFTYIGLDAARERCRQGAADGNVFVSRDYVANVRRAFERLGAEAPAEFDRTTEPLPFPERDLQVVVPGSIAGFSPL
jgi:cation transport regulator ChaC